MRGLSNRVNVSMAFSKDGSGWPMQHRQFGLCCCRGFKENGPSIEDALLKRMCVPCSRRRRATCFFYEGDLSKVKGGKMDKKGLSSVTHTSLFSR